MTITSIERVQATVRAAVDRAERLGGTHAEAIASAAAALGLDESTVREACQRDSECSGAYFFGTAGQAATEARE